MHPADIIDEFTSLLFSFHGRCWISFGWRQSNRAPFCSPTMTRGFPYKNNVWGWLSVCRIVAVGNRACRLKNESDREARRDGSRRIGARWGRDKKKRTWELWKVWPAPRLPMWSRCEGNYGLNSIFIGLGYLYYFWHYPVCHCFRRDTAEQIGSDRWSALHADPNDSRAANRRNEPIIEGTVVIFPEHRRWFRPVKTCRVIAFPICIDLAVSLFLTSHSLSLHVPLLTKRNGLPRERWRWSWKILLWSRNSKLVTSQTSSRFVF